MQKPACARFRRAVKSLLYLGRTQLLFALQEPLPLLTLHNTRAHTQAPAKIPLRSGGNFRQESRYTSSGVC